MLMSLNFREKELVAVSASVSASCYPCTSYHIKKARKAGVSDEEIEQAISDALSVCDSAKKIIEALGLKHLGISTKADEYGCCENTARMKELVSIAAAFAVNCMSNLEKHLTLARNMGIGDNEIKSIIDMTLDIKHKAASHVDRIIEKIGNNGFYEYKTSTNKGTTCGCDGGC